jgi:hypothetical protein
VRIPAAESLVSITIKKITAVVLFLGLTLVSCAPQLTPGVTPSPELALPTSTPERVAEVSPTLPATSTPTPVPTSTPPPSPTSTPTITPLPTPAPTSTPPPSPTSTPTITPLPTPVPTSTSLPTPTITPTPTPTEIALQPGSYDDGLLSIAVNDDVVTGFYENYTGWDEKLQAPRFSCLFFFVGRIENSRVEIAISDTRGTIELLGDDKIKISLEEEPGGCWNVEPGFDEEGVVFELTERREWRFIRMVSSERAYFYHHPDEKERGKSYVIEGDVLRVLEVAGDWVRGEYHGSQGITTGWIKESDLHDIDF